MRRRPSPPAPAAPPLVERLRAHIQETGLLGGARYVVAACSGGGDSVALLHLLSRVAPALGVGVVGAHVGHGLRGAAADRDARHAADEAARLSLPFAFVKADVNELRGKGESLEAAARRHRYRCLLALARDLGEGSLVATGHTRDDQAETVLINLHRHARRTRGGIRPRRADGVVRPLLPFRRAELRAFLDAETIAYQEDETNRDPRLLRNRVRLSVLPDLERRWPGVADRLARAADAWSARLDALDETVARLLAGRGAPPAGPWPRSLFRELGEEAAGRLLVRAVAAGDRVPGRRQLEKAVRRCVGPEPRFREALAGHVVVGDGSAIRLVRAARLAP